MVTISQVLPDEIARLLRAPALAPIPLPPDMSLAAARRFFWCRVRARSRRQRKDMASRLAVLFRMDPHAFTSMGWAPAGYDKSQSASGGANITKNRRSENR